MEERHTPVILNFLIRAVIGMAMIFFVNEFLASSDIASGVGLNLVTFAVTGTLGSPGVALLYGIAFCQGL